MMFAFRTNVEIFFDILLVEHMLARRARHPQPLGHILTGLQRKAVPF